MKFFALIKKFRRQEEGAVTVDWVVLTAAVIGLGVAALTAVSTGTSTLTGKISASLGAQTVATYTT